MSVAALLCLFRTTAGRKTRLVARALSILVGCTGLVTFANYFLEFHGVLNGFLFRAPILSLIISPGCRMAVITAILFSILGGVLFLLSSARRSPTDIGHAVLLPLSLAIYLVLLGYFYGIRALYFQMNLAIAFSTALAFLCLCFAAFCIRPETWLTTVFTSNGAGGTMARRLLPYILALPLAIGWIRLNGERLHFFSSEVGVALVAVTYTVCFLWIVWINARAVNKTDLQRFKAEETVREAQARTQAVLNGIAETFYSLDRQWRFTAVNPAAERAPFGRQASELLGKVIWDLFPGLVGTPIQKHYLDAAEHVRLEHYEALSPLNGRWYEVFMQGQTSGIDVYMRDISERKRAEESLRRLADELARSNKDLEQFAYVASHDLQEPLRAVGGFLGIIKKQYAPNLDEEAREYIDHAVDGAERMRTLIHGLLAFSRVGTKGGEFLPLAMTDAFRNAQSNLQTVIEETGAIITCENLPEITADLSHMTQLFQNLIGNAIKFHKPGEIPKVDVYSKRERGHWLFCVADNGIGIEPQYFDRIFLIFQRLHTRSQYQGTGIGLAVCKKIVERHGGTIWIESTPGQGSTFCFTVPDKGEQS